MQVFLSGWTQQKVGKLSLKIFWAHIFQMLHMIPRLGLVHIAERLKAVWGQGHVHCGSHCLSCVIFQIGGDLLDGGPVLPRPAEDRASAPAALCRCAHCGVLVPFSFSCIMGFRAAQGNS